ncbi:TonB-dependent receptor [Sphingomonas alpina]|uniref:TonB-dependent receptor n=1 Tax=Sphingomonas alpina TaxID=653931 RepID=A0A7H0LDJ3_9SPHN|nr:TonB-dependent receptor [Sphingomonas alpina]
MRTPLGFAYLGNAGKAVSQGLEIELNARDVAIRGLSLNLGYGYTDAKLTQTITGIGFKDERMPLVPRHAVSGMADYSTELSGDLQAGFAWLTSYTSGSYADFGRYKPVRDPVSGNPVAAAAFNRQYLPLDAYWLTNVSVRLEGKSWSARLFVDNLFDARFKTSRTFQNANSPYNAPDVSYNANRPRTIGLGLTKRF